MFCRSHHHRAASPSKIGQKSPRPSQNGLPSANHRHRPLLMQSQSLQWTHKGSGGVSRRSSGPGRAVCRSHNVASSLKILAKNQPGQVKMGCQAQTIDIYRCSCNPNPSIGPTNEVGTLCLLVIGPQRGVTSGPLVQCAALHTVQKRQKIPPAE